MPAEIGYRLEGGRELRSALKAAGADLGELREAHRRASDIVAAYASTIAPRRTGTLAASVRPGATQRAGVVRAGRATVPYAPPIHWGWPARGIRGDPFVSVAAQATEPRWLPVYLAEIDRITREVSS